MNFNRHQRNSTPVYKAISNVPAQNTFTIWVARLLDFFTLFTAQLHLRLFLRYSSIWREFSFGAIEALLFFGTAAHCAPALFVLRFMQISKVLIKNTPANK